MERYFEETDFDYFRLRKVDFSGQQFSRLINAKIGKVSLQKFLIVFV